MDRKLFRSCLLFALLHWGACVGAGSPYLPAQYPKPQPICEFIPVDGYSCLETREIPLNFVLQRLDMHWIERLDGRIKKVRAKTDQQ